MKQKEINTNIVKDILEIANKAVSNALQAVNTQLVIRNWLIGKRIDQEILTTRSNDYGKGLIKNLAIELCKYGDSFNYRNLYWYHRFYLLYPNILNTARSNSSFLAWSHYRLLIEIKAEEERKWYENQILWCNWNYRQLERNIKTDMYHRVISNKIDANSKKLANTNQNDYLKSLMILEFLGLKEKDKYKEFDLQKALEINMSKFLLELGRGYTFAGKQVHLRTNNNDYYIDLVFYNTILKRYLLIDLKVCEIKHKDIGQMLFYLRLFDKQIILMKLINQ